ncbi:MAG: hypothetical protein A4E57_04581 [Syntrophorhabdaceae bacterium PtaU1.Bin034]|jgi:Arc/MetJ-type ribon-helix-helix transcriptional regulator|nr:MAG: hypothetical protein A4E57_04581 [Syntrophorhabdaceae bacterium PtaU1.Bin034]
MGKNISVYLPDDQVNFINAQKEGASQVIQRAINLIMKADKNKQGYDDVLAAAETIRKGQNLDEAIKSWHDDRDTDRW